MRILVIGDAMLDRYWFGEAERLSPEAPVPVVDVKTEQWRLGAAANVAHNCVALGAEAMLVCTVGRDAEARRLRAMCAAAGIDNLTLGDVVWPAGGMPGFSTCFAACSAATRTKSNAMTASPPTYTIMSATARLMAGMLIALNMLGCLVLILHWLFF